MKRLIAAAILFVPWMLGPVSCASSTPQAENICDAWNLWGPDERDVFIGNIWDRVVPNVMTSLEKFDLSDGQRQGIRECLVGERQPFLEDVGTACAKTGAYVTSDHVGEMAGARSGACVERVL